jgi:radical SAM family uncharacterized protein/radical SAM-linked protein
MKHTTLSSTELLSVQKPAQYLGGEVGSVVKNENEVDLHLCLAFPDTYEVGMAHVGYQILYDLINRHDRYWAERAYVPLPDMEALLRATNTPLSSLEAKRPLSGFDVVGFSLQYELCMNGVLTMLELGQIPLLAKDRDNTAPLVIGGGPVVYHPEPFADFFDAFLVGDGEELVPEFLAALQRARGQGLGRAETLSLLSVIQGVYVPSLFTANYNSEQVFTGVTSTGKTETIQRRVIATLENAPFPKEPIVPNIRAVHDRLSVEVMRGCVRGCRFCQAGYLYRPQRERSPEEVKDIVGECLKSSGYEELSLLSLSTADYCSILPLLNTLKESYAKDDHLAISFPSTRVDALKPELLQEVQSVRRTGFTMAPEAGTQRLRDVINKGVTDEEIMETCRNVFYLGWSSVKLYFMIGLPTETDDDIYGILDVAKRVKKIAGPHRQVTISVSTHIPKPHTPFQWAEQLSIAETKRKQHILRTGLKEIRAGFRYHDAESSFLEGAFARGDRKLGGVIQRAYELGCRLDGWVEELRFDTWIQAFEECGIDPNTYLRERGEDDPLPWDHIDCDIPKKYFLKEWKRATSARITPDCLTQNCSSCGTCDYDAVRNVLFDRRKSQNRLNIVHTPWEEVIERREQGLDPLGISEDDETRSSNTPAPKKEQGKYRLKEYLQTESDSSPAPATRSVHPIVQRLRCRYTKLGNARYISHLELANVFFRAARRANIAVAYSRGFNPRAKMSFGPPVQLGLASLSEYVDIALIERYTPEDFQHCFNGELPADVQLLEVVEIGERTTSLQATIDAQSFEATIEEESLSEIEIERIGSTLGRWETLEVVRRRKKRRTVKTILLGKCVNSIEFADGVLQFDIRYDNSSATVKPFELVEAVTGLPAEQFDIRKTGVTFARDQKGQKAVG